MLLLLFVVVRHRRQAAKASSAARGSTSNDTYETPASLLSLSATLVDRLSHDNCATGATPYMATALSPKTLQHRDLIYTNKRNKVFTGGMRAVWHCE